MGSYFIRSETKFIFPDQFHRCFNRLAYLFAFDGLEFLRCLVVECEDWPFGVEGWIVSESRYHLGPQSDGAELGVVCSVHWYFVVVVRVSCFLASELRDNCIGCEYLGARLVNDSGAFNECDVARSKRAGFLSFILGCF